MMQSVDDQAEQLLLSLVAKSKRVIAWGEIGLDYHYDHSPREVQREVFRRQFAPRAQKLPVVIHSRSADDDTIAILRESYWLCPCRCPALFWRQPGNGEAAIDLVSSFHSPQSYVQKAETCARSLASCHSNAYD